MNADWDMLAHYDERETSKPEYSDHKHCFTRVCNKFYYPDNYVTDDWDNQCPSDIKICNGAATVLKGNQMTFSQALTCMDVSDEAFARTPDEERARNDMIAAIISAYQARFNSPEPDPQPEPDDNSEQYFSISSSLLCIVFCAVLILIGVLRS
jgi:hypothetical protein